MMSSAPVARSSPLHQVKILQLFTPKTQRFRMLLKDAMLMMMLAILRKISINEEDLIKATIQEVHTILVPQMMCPILCDKARPTISLVEIQDIETQMANLSKITLDSMAITTLRDIIRMLHAQSMFKLTEINH